MVAVQCCVLLCVLTMSWKVCGPIDASLNEV